MSTSVTQPSPTFVPSVFLDAPKWNHAGLPEWFVQSQLTAWENFTNLPMPGRRDENWRFANISQVNLAGFRRIGGVQPVAVGLEKVAARVVTGNDEVFQHQSSGVSGLEVLSLKDALTKHGDKLRPFLTAPDTGLGGVKFASLNHAQLRNAVVVIAAKGCVAALPVEIIHSLNGENASDFPRTIVIAEEGAHVTVVEHHLSADSAAGLSCGAAQIEAARGAVVNYIQLNRQNAASKFLHFTTLSCGPDAQVKHAQFNLGGGYVRSESLSQVAGENSRSEMLSVSLASDDQEIDQRTLQDHLTPHGFSDLLYKNVLFGRAKTIFAGLIRVADGAHFTDAYQKCRNLLLSDECEANSMPGLEINADQVKCSHGSTSGRLSEEEIFYLESRGIPRRAAEHMISLGFTQEVISRVGNESVEALILEAMEARFAELEK